MEKENLMKVVAPNLRSVVLSCKGGVFLDNLEKDYRELLGSPIPYRKMGFNTLDAMLRAMPNVVRIVKDNTTHRAKVIAVADEATQHIQKMIAKQRDSRQRSVKRYRIPMSRPSSYNQRSRITRQYPPSGRRVLLSPPRSSGSAPVSFRVQVSSPPVSDQNHLQKEPPASKKGLVISKTNFEVPPRFLKKQVHVTNNIDQGASGRSSPSSSSTISSSSFKAPASPSVARSSSSSSFRSPLSNEYSEPTSPVAPETLPSRNFGPKALPTVANIPDPKIPQRSTTPHGTTHSTVNFNAQTEVYGARPKPAKSRKVAAMPPLPATQLLSAKERVDQHAKMNDLKVEYQTKPAGKQKFCFFSVLKLGQKKFYSYRAEDNEKRTAEAAEELAASLALEYINEENKKRYPETSLGNTEDIKNFVAEIELIVSEKPGGLWSHGMPNEYKNKCGESLPQNWLSVIEENSSVIEIERPEGLNIPNNACILRTIKMSSGTTTPTSTSSRASVCLDEEQHQHILPHVDNEMADLVSRVPPLVLPDDAELVVYVCAVASAVDVSVQLYENREELEKMVENMGVFYSKNNQLVSHTIKNKVYAAFDDEMWYRVLVEDIFPDLSKVKCNFVDFGFSSEKSISSLRELDESFETLPFQAIHVKLHGLENYPEIKELSDMILDKALIAKVIERQPSVVVELFDTSEIEDVNVNISIKVQTLEALLKFSVLPEPGIVGRFYLVHISENGIISLLGADQSHEILSSEIQKLREELEAKAGQLPEELSDEKVYAVKYPIDDSWCRAMPTGSFESATETKPYEVEMYFVDYGNILLVPLSSVSELPDWLCELPRLAQECILSGVPPDLVWNESVINKLYDLSPDMEPLTVRVDEAATDELPAKVSIFKRSSNGEEVISINDSLIYSTPWQNFIQNMGKSAASPPVTSNAPIKLMNLDLSRPVSNTIPVSFPDVVVPASVVDEQIEKFSAIHMDQPVGTTASFGGTEHTPIPPAPLPKKNKDFDVYVCLAANPSNFVVQPLETSPDLDALLREMRQFYSLEENTCEMHSILLHKGEYYAAHHSDGDWYRAKLVKVMEGTDLVIVHLVDFGEFLNISMNKLQPLFKKFRSLPCQALKATLHGVKPNFKDWEPEECLKFRKLVEERQFVSFVVDHQSSTEEIWDGYVLQLILIDTTDPRIDVSINDILVEKKLAVKA